MRLFDILHAAGLDLIMANPLRVLPIAISSRVLFFPFNYIDGKLNFDFLYSDDPCTSVWRNTKRGLYLWHWIGKSSRPSPINLNQYAWHVLYLTQHDGWVETNVCDCFAVLGPLCERSDLQMDFFFWKLQVKNLERSYIKMWTLHCSGQKPQHFKVTENDLGLPLRSIGIWEGKRDCR